MTDIDVTEEPENWEVLDSAHNMTVVTLLREDGFNKFLTEKINVPKSEYFLPFQIDELIKKDEKQVEVLVAEDKWYGMTYKEDKPVVKAAIAEMTKNGLYDGI